MNDKPFFDTNVILYAFSQDDTRGQVAETLLAVGPVKHYLGLIMMCPGLDCVDPPRSLTAIAQNM